MTTVYSPSLEEQLILRIEREYSQAMDEIIQKMQEIAREFDIAKYDKKSPFRNVLSVATEPSASLEIVKNYIRYQVGRKESSPIWKLTKDKNLFATVIVDQIDGLSKDTKQIIERVKSALPANSPLHSYLNDSQKQEELQKNIHLKLVQLYLGYLMREHTALVGYGKGNQEQPQERNYKK